MGEFYVKIFDTGKDRVASICDKDVFGRTLEDSERGIKITIGTPFYGGELMELDEALDIIKRSTIVNLIGNKIVEAAITHGLIVESAVIEIQGVKHVQIIQFDVGQQD